MSDNLFRERLERELEEANPNGSTTARARLRDHKKDEHSLTRRIKEHRIKMKQKSASKVEKEEEILARKRADEVVGKNNRRTTNMRLRLRRELITKVSVDRRLTL